MEEIVTLASLNNGAALERFQRELDRVIENIVDVNTPAKFKREIKLKFTFAPDEDRSLSYVSIVCEAKLAGAKPITSVIYLGRDKEQKLVAVANNFTAPSLFDTDAPTITPIRQVGFMPGFTPNGEPQEGA